MEKLKLKSNINNGNFICWFFCCCKKTRNLSEGLLWLLLLLLLCHWWIKRLSRIFFCYTWSYTDRFLNASVFIIFVSSAWFFNMKKGIQSHCEVNFVGWIILNVSLSFNTQHGCNIFMLFFLPTFHSFLTECLIDKTSLITSFTFFFCFLLVWGEKNWDSFIILFVLSILFPSNQQKTKKKCERSY